VCNELEVRARFCEDDQVKEILLGLWNNEKTIRRPKNPGHSNGVWKIEPMNDRVKTLNMFYFYKSLKIF